MGWGGGVTFRVDVVLFHYVLLCLTNYKSFQFIIAGAFALAAGRKNVRGLVSKLVKRQSKFWRHLCPFLFLTLFSREFLKVFDL